MGTITGCTSHPHPSFTPQPFPTSHLTSPSIFRSLPSFFSALSSPNRSLTRLLAPTCHSNRLPPSLALSIRRFSLFSLYLVVLVPFLLSLSRPSFSPSSSCFVSSPPCLSPLWPSSFFSTSFSSSCEIHTHHMHGHYFALNFCILVSSCLSFPSHHSCPFCSTTSPPPPSLSPSPLWFYIIFPFFSFMNLPMHAAAWLQRPIRTRHEKQTWGDPPIRPSKTGQQPAGTDGDRGRCTGESSQSTNTLEFHLEPNCTLKKRSGFKLPCLVYEW